MSESNGNHIEIKVGPRDRDSGRSLVEAYFRNSFCYRDRLDVDVGFGRESFVKRLKGVMRAREDFSAFETEQYQENYCPSGHGDDDDPFNNFKWIDWHIVNEAHKLDAEQVEGVKPVKLSQLIKAHPHLNEPVVGGLLRRCEVGNIIAPSKVGKSWATYGLAMSVISGSAWLDVFPCTKGDVLIVDNELHKPTIAHRLQTVAEAYGAPDDWGEHIELLSLRGRLLSLPEIVRVVQDYERDRFVLVVLDAWYRTLPKGTSENDNAGVMALYNMLDAAAEKLNACWVCVHHSSKGAQSDKSVTDVGAGAGSQSRAADCHCIMRQHEEKGVYVLEAAVRSFKPVEPLALAWEYPLWVRADANPALLKGRLTAKEQRDREKDQDGLRAIVEAIQSEGPLTVRKLRAQTGMSRERIERLLVALEKDQQVSKSTIVVRGNSCDEYQLQDVGDE